MKTFNRSSGGTTRSYRGSSTRRLTSSGKSTSTESKTILGSMCGDSICTGERSKKKVNDLSTCLVWEKVLGHGCHASLCATAGNRNGYEQVCIYNVDVRRAVLADYLENTLWPSSSMKDHRVSTAVSHCFFKAFFGVVSNRGAVFLFAKKNTTVRCVADYSFRESYGEGR